MSFCQIEASFEIHANDRFHVDNSNLLSVFVQSVFFMLQEYSSTLCSISEQKYARKPGQKSHSNIACNTPPTFFHNPSVTLCCAHKKLFFQWFRISLRQFMDPRRVHKIWTMFPTKKVIETLNHIPHLKSVWNKMKGHANRSHFLKLLLFDKLDQARPRNIFCWTYCWIHCLNHRKDENSWLKTLTHSSHHCCVHDSQELHNILTLLLCQKAQ